MTNEALKIRVAELCPDLFIHVASPFGRGGIHWRTGRNDNGELISPGAHVDLLNDLNAMAETVATLTGQQYRIYLRHLDEITGAPGHSITWQTDRARIEATARQRAEAFVKVMEGRDAKG